jgi:hypothetical protein
VRAPLLISFVYFGHRPTYEHFLADVPPPRLFLDSGAFTALQLGHPVDIHEYARWLQGWEHRAFAYANLDVIGNAEGTRANQRVLEHEYGLSPVPVFHCGSEWRHLEQLRDEGYTYIGLGGIVAHRKNELLPRWVAQAFRVAGPDVRFHAFGVGQPALLRRFGFYSSDATSWAAGYRYGRLVLFDPQRHHRPFMAWHHEAWKYASLIRAAGVDPANIVVGNGGHGSPFRNGVMQIALHTVEEWRRYLTARHGAISAPTRGVGEAVDGPLLFIADSSVSNIPAFARIAGELHEEAAA